MIPVFVLGLILAWLFGVVLRDSPISLPPSGRYTAGIVPIPLTPAWGLTGLQGPLRALADFVSDTAILNAILTGQWNVLRAALRHLILPAIALGTIPMAIIARMTRSQPARRARPRLRADRPCQGPRRTGRRLPACPPQRACCRW